MSEKNLIAFLFMLVSISCNNDAMKTDGKTIHYNEEILKSFIISTPDISESNALNVLDSIVNKAAKDSSLFRKTLTYLETPFGNPNSAYKNENLYSSLLQAKIKSPWYDSITKAKARGYLYLQTQNRVGSAANDFIYITPAGFKKKMYDLHSDFILIYFYNPECNACKEMKEALIASTVIANKMATGELKILAVYTDREEKMWLDHLNEMPKEWIHGRDEDEYLFKNSVYNLKAIPSIYLLDKDKKVVLNDCVEMFAIEKYLYLN